MYVMNDFEQHALEVFRHQAEACAVYGSFIHHLGISPGDVQDLSGIPFLPVEFFKTHDVILDGTRPEIVFTSSGTTGTSQSKHLVRDVSLYTTSYRHGFELFYGDPADFVFLALLPSYRERSGSSLIYMVDGLIRLSRHEESGYVLNAPRALHQTLTGLRDGGKKVILIGVTYALLDFVEAYPIEFPTLVVMETGGMKGRRRELVREELHTLLCRGFGVPAIHSEYGMTELLSQAYSTGAGIFRCPPWMKVIVRDMYDPFSQAASGRTGGINVIDLANRNSCSFIATQDLGKLYADDSFEVLGRFDTSDVRGCNLLVER